MTWLDRVLLRRRETKALIKITDMMKDHDRMWREMMTHWSASDSQLPVAMTAEDAEAFMVQKKSFRVYVPASGANFAMLYGPTTATIAECEAELDRIEEEDA